MTLYAVAATALPAPTFGPTGTYAPDNWPFPFDKDKTATAANLAQLQAAINAAPEAGVIEYSGSLAGTSSSHIRLTTPSAWASRDVGVLVRAPLGSRLPVGYADVKGHNLILGGPDVSHSLGVTAADATVIGGASKGVWFWRAVATAGAVIWPINGGSYGGLCEVVAAKRGHNTGGDQIDLYAQGTADSIGQKIVGGHLAGKMSGTGTAYAHLGEVNDVTAGDYSTTVTVTGTATTFFFALRNCPAGTTVGATLKVNGSTIWAGAVPDTAAVCGDVQDFLVVGAYAQGNAISQPLTAGDTITVSVDGALPNLEFWIGDQNQNHIDTVQTGHANVTGHTGGICRNVEVAHSVLFGSNGQTIQPGNLDGYFTFDSSWLGKANGQGLNVSDFQTPLAPRVPVLNVINCQAPRALAMMSPTSGIHYTAPWLGDIERNQVGLALPTDFPVSNTYDPTFATSAPPTCADLASIWPECPPTGWQN